MNCLSATRPLSLFAAVVVLLLPPAASSQSNFLSDLNETLQQVVSKVKPSVVRIDVLTENSQSYDGAAVRQSQLSPTGLQQYVAAGLILSPDGYVMTDVHVVRGATSIKVTFDNEVRKVLGKSGSNSLRAQIVGEFPEADLALLKVDATGLTPIMLETSQEKLREGQLVFSLGSPEGLSNTISLGVISSLARQLDPDDPIPYIQTDAAVNPGSSGGALVDIKGHLVGINAKLMTEGGGSERLGFAIPSRFVEFAYQSIREHGKVVWGDPGLKVQGITPSLVQGLHLTQNSGVIVSDVIPESPAAMAGLKILDVITQMDGKPIETVPDYFETLLHKKPGQELAMSVVRRAKQIDVAVVLVPSEQLEAAGRTASVINLVSRLGVFCSALSSHSDAAVQKLRSRRGVLVEARSSEDTRQTPLAPGDVIRSVNLRPVFSVGDLENVLNHTGATQPIILQVERDSQFLFLSLEQ